MRRLLEHSERERGATLVEYSVLMAMIAVAMIFSLQLLGAAVAASFSEIDASLQATASVQQDNNGPNGSDDGSDSSDDGSDSSDDGSDSSDDGSDDD